MRLTVIMPVHNAMPFLKEAVNSITSQTYQDLRLLIVDDGSTDGSPRFLKTIDNDKVSVTCRKTRGGQGAARNLALAQCETEYTAFMDADDVSLQTRFSKQIQFLDENQDIGAVGAKVFYIGESGRKGFSPPLALKHDEIRKDLLRKRHALVNATMMFRTEVLQKAGGFRIDGAGEDWDLFLRITELSRVANLDEILYLYRVHRNSSTAVQAKHVGLRYAHACECARVRCKGGAEPNFDEFCDQQQKLPFWQRWIGQLDAHASARYREAVEEILNGGRLTGYPRLVLAGALSPGRLAQRAKRTLRTVKPIGRAGGRGDERDRV